MSNISKFEREKFYNGPLTESELKDAYIISHGYPVVKIDNKWIQLTVPASELAPKIQCIFVTSLRYNNVSEVLRLLEEINTSEAATEIANSAKELKDTKLIVSPIVIRSVKLAIVFVTGHVWIAGIVSLLLHAIFGFWLVWKELHFLFPGTPDITTIQCEAQKP